jgi:hypothetical protein
VHPHHPMSPNRPRRSPVPTGKPGGAPSPTPNLDERDDWAGAFVMAVLRIGLMLEGLLSNLLEDLPDDAFPGEDNGVVLVEMLTGTIRSVATTAGERVVRDATKLLCASGDRTIEGLRAALALRVAMDRNSRNQG